jgi:hypothetical protein
MTSNADADVGMEAIANGRATITPAIIRFITKSPLLNYFRLSQQTFMWLDVSCLNRINWS